MRWFTTEELRFIRDAEGMTDAEIGKQLNRSSQSVSAVRRRFGVKNKGKFRRMTQEVKDYILANPDINDWRMSKIIGYRHTTVRSFRRKHYGIGN